MEVVAVRIPPSARASTCLANGHELAVGDSCVVETDGGVALGIVTRAVLENPMVRSDGKWPAVLRKASRDDEEAFAHKESTESAGRDYCLERIRAMNLPMKLGHAEMQLDGKKLTFFFTAEGRVDFRALVRDLAHRFQTRIELRQVGSRDDAMMQGGCGTCGQSLCCSTWMKGFAPVSIKMAKAQGLSLNPSKISGMCGRLMCCLKYEYDGKAPARPRGKGRSKGGPRGGGDKKPDA